MTSLRHTTLTFLTICALCAAPSLAAKGGGGGKGGPPPSEDPPPAEEPSPDSGSGSWDRKNSAQNQFILRGESGEIANIAARYGLTVLESVASNSPGGDVALLEGPEVMTEEQILDMLEPDSAVLSSEATTLASLPLALLEQSTMAILEQSTMAILESVDAVGVTSDQTLAAYFSAPVWSGYTDQPAAQVLGLANAHGVGYGSGVVAVIDNGVDPDHPLLQGAVVGGYDFILDQPGTPSEWNNLDPETAASLQQSTMAILEQSTMAILEGQGDFHLLEQSSAAILEQSTMAILEQHSLPPSFGHGTLVAGIIRLVAPGAQIMPLRAFDGAGTGNLFDIVRAVHYAVDNGADVINMSFSLDAFSPELARAIDYARRNGVVCVAAAGNQGRQKPAFPASFGTTIGVGSTNDLDELSSFSNRGADLVLVTAPGEGVISSYPGGTYAAAWGTSFAAPFVSGTLALMHHDYSGLGLGGGGTDQYGNVTRFFESMSAVAGGAQPLPLLAAEVSIGRLDIAGAVLVESGASY